MGRQWPIITFLLRLPKSDHEQKKTFKNGTGPDFKGLFKRCRRRRAVSASSRGNCNGSRLYFCGSFYYGAVFRVSSCKRASGKRGKGAGAFFCDGNGKIELTGDNFVQLLLEAVNKQHFRAWEDLKQVLDQVQGMPQRAKSPVQGFSGTQGNINMGAAGGFPQSASIPGSRPIPSVQTAQVSQAAVPVQPAMPVQQVPPVQPVRPVSAPTSGAPSGSSLSPAPENKKGKFGKPSLKGSKKEKAKEKTKPVKESTAVEEDGFDPEKAKKKFLLPQAVVMVAVAALVSFGAFTDEYGDIAVNNILAVVLILAVTEVILYREAYVNSRKKGNKKTDKKAVQKNSGKKPAAPGKPSGFGNAGAKPAAPSGFGNAGSRPEVPSQSGFGNAGAKPAAPSGFNNAGSQTSGSSPASSASPASTAARCNSQFQASRHRLFHSSPFPSHHFPRRRSSLHQCLRPRSHLLMQLCP